MPVSNISAGQAAQLIKPTPANVNGTTAQSNSQRSKQLASNPTTSSYSSASAPTNSTSAPSQNSRGQTVGSVVNTKA
ncbi:MAG: hypothetical protein JO142_19585 [Burkholderiales bacterium]|nr:hypothetical protein [Burkholderiales bacterium]